MFCNHNTINCGCKDSYLTTPPPCPTPTNCPDPQPCSEVFDAQCIIYSGDPLTCGSETIIPTNTSVSDSLSAIVDILCSNSTLLQSIGCIEEPVIAVAGTPVSEALDAVVDYFCNAIANIPVTIVEAGDDISVTSNTVGNITTYTVSTAAPLLRKAVYTDTVVDVNGLTFTIARSEYIACIPSVDSCGALTGSLSDLIIQGYYFDSEGAVWEEFLHQDRSSCSINVTGDITIHVGIPAPSYPFNVRIIIIG